MMTDVMTSTPPQFAALCQTLYGELVDPDVVWDAVAKLAPDQADRSTKGSSLRNKLERGSNALGLTAAGMATGAALRDERFEHGGKIAQRLYATGKKIPSPISSLKGRKGALLAGGALAVQGANIVGDVAISGTLAAQGKEQKKGKLVAKSAATLFDMPALPKVTSAADGLRGHWTKMTSGLFDAGKPKAALPAATRPSSPGVGQPSLPGLDTKTVPNPSKARAAGRNVMGAVRSKEGQTGLALGAAGTAGAVAATKKKPSYDSGYDLAKSDVEDVVWEGEFSKLDTDQRLAFGWASVVSLNGSPVVDRQGDYIEPEEIEKAAYAYVHGSRVGGDMHRRNGEVAHKVSDLVESMVFTDDKVAKMGLPDDFPRGWWVGYKIHDNETWDLVKKGERTGFSIHGKGVRKDHDLDSLMGY